MNDPVLIKWQPKKNKSSMNINQHQGKFIIISVIALIIGIIHSFRIDESFIEFLSVFESVISSF